MLREESMHNYADTFLPYPMDWQTLKWQTTYPYDREYEVKKSFWESPEKTGIPYVMDGLSLGEAEKSFVCGNDWPNAYYKFLNKRSQAGDMPWLAGNDYH